MKPISTEKLLLLAISALLALMTFSACGDDNMDNMMEEEMEEEMAFDCIDENILGNWLGSAQCDSSTVNLISFALRKDGNDYIATYLTRDIPATVTGCNISAFGEHPTIEGLFYGIEGDIDSEGMFIGEITETGGPFTGDRCDAQLRLQ